VILAIGRGGSANKLEHMESDVIGLKRTLTLYDAGRPIQSWHTRSRVE
jgi:hypothetical protein